MAEKILAILPITGMDCANCATAVERNIKKVPGVDQVNVNLTTERATFEYDSDSAKILEVIEKINRAGYGIAAGESEYLVKGLEDDRDGRRLEAFLSEIGGLTSINVNWISGKVILKYIPTILNQTDIRNLIIFF